MSKRILCGVCDGEAQVVTEVRQVAVGARTTEVEVSFARCENCGEEFYLPGQMAEAQRAASEKIRREEGILQPEEVKGIREKYGLSQKDFETLIGAGEKTVTRWEHGTVFQNGTANTLLLVLREFPQTAAWLGMRRSVEVSVARMSMRHTGEFRGSFPPVAFQFVGEIPEREVEPLWHARRSKSRGLWAILTDEPEVNENLALGA